MCVCVVNGNNIDRVQMESMIPLSYKHWIPFGIRFFLFIRLECHAYYADSVLNWWIDIQNKNINKIYAKQKTTHWGREAESGYRMKNIRYEILLSCVHNSYYCTTVIRTKQSTEYSIPICLLYFTMLDNWVPAIKIADILNLRIYMDYLLFYLTFIDFVFIVGKRKSVDILPDEIVNLPNNKMQACLFWRYFCCCCSKQSQLNIALKMMFKEHKYLIELKKFVFGVIRILYYCLGVSIENSNINWLSIV